MLYALADRASRTSALSQLAFVADHSHHMSFVKSCNTFFAVPRGPTPARARAGPRSVNGSKMDLFRETIFTASTQEMRTGARHARAPPSK
ncbi:hypothetical protein EVAR_59274_1 [Eumeta japonica]|uniref:Uncharacterized protein n=1 Tax=Eumeta variegata TaxID=151549 RepID=A0A4C1YPK2_EUMVA|nr:hypothetical protein EVAR_59274_1 [Eumeta japonica]